MKIKAVKYQLAEGDDPKKRELLSERVEFDIDPPNLPVEISTETQAVVFLVKMSDLVNIRDCEGVLPKNRGYGKKDPRKSLSDYLLGKPREKLPTVIGHYGPDGDQVERSVRKCLEKAEANDEHRPFVVGVDEALYERMAYGAKPGSVTKSKNAIRSAQNVPDDDRLSDIIEKVLKTDLTPTDKEYLEELKNTFIGDSPYFELIRLSILTAAKADPKVPVLILGETGTGKDRVARSVHEYYLRYRHKNIKESEIGKPENINCGAIPTDLFESELFGAEPGAYTGLTKRKIGLWELANNKTLFLDEIGDLSLHHQVKILRALSSGKIRRVGGIEEIPVNARIVAATNKNLQEMVKIGEKAGGFREDLYYRLKGITIRTVPLDSTSPESLQKIMQSSWSRIVNPDSPKKTKKKSESTTDANQETANSVYDEAKSILSTATNQQQQSEETPALPDELIAKLSARSWPGNVRELRAVLFQLYSWFGKDSLTPEKLDALQYLEDHVWNADPFTD